MITQSTHIMLTAVAAATAETARAEAPVVAATQSAVAYPVVPLVSIAAVIMPATGMVNAVAILDPTGIQMTGAVVVSATAVTLVKVAQQDPAVVHTVVPVVVQPEARLAIDIRIISFFFLKVPM